MSIEEKKTTVFCFRFRDGLLPCRRLLPTGEVAECDGPGFFFFLFSNHPSSCNNRAACTGAINFTFCFLLFFVRQSPTENDRDPPNKKGSAPLWKNKWHTHKPKKKERSHRLKQHRTTTTLLFFFCFHRAAFHPAWRMRRLRASRPRDRIPFSLYSTFPSQETTTTTTRTRRRKPRRK